MRRFEEPHCVEMLLGDKEYKVYDGNESGKLYFEEISEDNQN